MVSVGEHTLGCYGNTAVKTQHIDRLAQRGVRFERAYVQYPVCNASRTSFLTGLRPDQTGVTDNTTLMRDKLPDVVTFPQLLKDHVIAKIESLGNQPWIIGAGFMKPHDPFVAPKKYFDLYPEGSLKLPMSDPVQAR